MACLFLDRDGTLNQRIMGGYVRSAEEFIILPGVLDALRIFAEKYERIFIVTNQQGIGKGLMTEEDLNIVHGLFLKQVEEAGGRIDKIYFCPALKSENSFMRKPSIGMAVRARHEYPEVKLKDCVMVGDTMTDMLFGRRAGMKTVLVGDEPEVARQYPHLVDLRFDTILEYAQTL